MKKYRNNNKRRMIILGILLLTITIGYAALGTSLNINGTTGISNATWDIHFNNVQVTNGSVAIGQGDHAAVITQGNTQEVTYAVTLNTPGDFYEFSVDAVNSGSIDAMVDTVVSTYKIGNGTPTVITSNNLPAYLNYSTTYSDGTAIAQNHKLDANTTETYKVRIEFKRDIENNQLPESPQTITFNFAVNYKQADSNAIVVPHDNGVYTVNTNSTGGYINIGQAIPSGITTYQTPALAMAAFSNRPFYLKHTISNNTVTESYVGFVVTNAMAQANPGMTAGTYYLRGGVDETSFVDKPIFIQNAKTIYDAFGTNCSTNPYITEITSDYFFYCLGFGLNAYVYENGNTFVTDDDSVSCNVNDEGYSFC